MEKVVSGTDCDEDRGDGKGDDGGKAITLIPPIRAILCVSQEPVEPLWKRHKKRRGKSVTVDSESAPCGRRIGFTTQISREIPAEKNLGRRNRIRAQRMIRMCVLPFVRWGSVSDVVLALLASCQPRSSRSGSHDYLKNSCDKIANRQVANRVRMWRKGRMNSNGPAVIPKFLSGRRH